ncbi:uncharacterized protein LOC133294304 [Gastrolobium bilobum]|uniref:uncharacterized protein LOC133294304 n=1 Tax=Gastrolobium bilobum TaxID=150636 RepID=UPI002AAF65F6|nr:uncharacterized protein LOC133294304 [Gastrolobium bilobum]
MFSKYDFLKDVNPAKEDWRIKVKVVRAWKVPNFQRRDFDDNVEMVLLDEQGGRIHATVKGSLPVRKKIHEGEPTKHQYRLSFNLRTDVKSIVDSDISASEFDFVDYDIIEKETSDSLYLVDVIGLVSGIGEVCDRVVSGRKTKMVELELDNLSLSADGVESSLRMTQLSTQSSYSFENDFLRETEKKSISDVKLCGEVADLDQFPEELNVLNEKSISNPPAFLHNSDVLSPLPPTLKKLFVEKRNSFPSELKDGKSTSSTLEVVELVEASNNERCKKSNSTEFSKQLRFQRELNSRSNSSDSKDVFIFLNPPAPEPVLRSNDEANNKKKGRPATDDEEKNSFNKPAFELVLM